MISFAWQKWSPWVGARGVEDAVKVDGAVLVHVVAHSKTGVHAPSLALLDELEAEHGARLLVVIDAAQARVGERVAAQAEVVEEIAERLERNRMADEQLAELAFANKISKHVKSNAIVLTHDRTVVGVGAGQMSRVDSVRIAAHKAGDRASGSVLASDAFFPFPDGVEAAIDAGVSAIVQPGGSVRDGEVVAAADAKGVPMLFSGARHFRH